MVNTVPVSLNVNDALPAGLFDPSLYTIWLEDPATGPYVPCNPCVP